MTKWRLKAGLVTAWIVAGLLPGVEAEERAKPDPESKRRMWLLAVGESPPFRQVIENGVRRELPPPPGSIPPRTITVSGAGTGEVAGGVSLALGRISPAYELAGGQGKLVLREGDEKSWLEVSTPEKGDFVIVIWRGGKDWTQPAAKVLPIEEKPGLVVFLNLSPGTLGLEWDDRKLGLKPGQQAFSRTAGAPQALRVNLLSDAGAPTRLAQRTIEQSATEWSLVVFCRADGVKPRQPVKTTVVRLGL
ncbi:hypothetical protein [Haloferula sargassicola]|uniref:DUF4384 domain-containing protein n=1 Tax=Haloferula sargassicola TaxID=490096 RepID=A0ABP9USE8_9BACT